jgi:hypothetical protein
MLRDYKPSKKPPGSVKKKPSKFKLDLKILFGAFLVLIVVFLAAMAIKNELSKLYKLKENERVLLTKDQKLVAILFFDVNNKQLVVTDLRQNNFDLSSLSQEASVSGNLRKNMVYSFLLDMVFDQSYEYPAKDLSKESLITFFKEHKIYYLFLKDKQLLWREQQFRPELPSVTMPVFDCPVALINTTGETGLASSLASLLEKSAFSIVKKDSNDQNLEQTRIVYDPEEGSCGKPLEKLKKILPQSLITADKPETSSHRAALVIYIGRDLADLYLFFVNFFHGQL